jgi:hypothetical protein
MINFGEVCMLYFISPRERRLARFLKPEATVWHWVLRACRGLGMDVQRNEYLEKLMNQQFQDHDFLGIAGGFVFFDGRYLLQLQTPEGGFVERECFSLFEVASIISFKLQCWTANEIGNPPDFSKAALSSNSPSEFIEKYLEIRRYKRVEHSRRLWFSWLTRDIDQDEFDADRLGALAPLIFEDYREVLRNSYRLYSEEDESFEALGIDREKMDGDILLNLRPLVLEHIKLHRPHVYSLYSLCQDIHEVARLLQGDTGFLSARKALMGSEQRDHLFSGDLGL